MRGFIKIIIKILRCNKGVTDLVTLTFVSWLVIMLMVAGIDIFFMASKFMTVNNVTQAALDAMKHEGYYSEGIAEGFNNIIEKHGFEIERDVFIGDRTTEIAQRGETIHLTVKTIYPIRSFQPIGYSFDVPWTVRKTGISYRFVR